MMRKLIYSLLTLALFVACTNDDSGSGVEYPAVRATADYLTIDKHPDFDPGAEDDKPDSPMIGVTIGGSAYTEYSWESGDCFAVTSSGGLGASEPEMMFARSSGSSDVPYEGYFDAVKSIDTYYAVYPYNSTLIGGDRQFYYEGEFWVDYSSQDGTDRNAALLTAMVRDVAIDELDFQFYPTNALLHVTVKNLREGEELRSAVLKQLSGASFTTKFQWDIRNNRVAGRVDGSQITIDWPDGDGFFIALPPYLSLDEFSITLKTQSDELTVEYPACFFDKGYTYLTTIDMGAPQLRVSDPITDYTTATFDITTDNVDEAYWVVTTDEGLTAEQVFAKGTSIEPNTTVREHVDNLIPSTTYNLFLAAKADSEYLMAPVVKFSTTYVGVTCGAKTSYDLYLEGNSHIANRMLDVAILLGERFTGGSTRYDTGSYSTYVGVPDDKISSAGVLIKRAGGTEELDYPLNFGDGYIGRGVEYNLDYTVIGWDEYTATAYLLLKDGTYIYSDAKTLHVTGFPYDSKAGRFHGFYTTDRKVWTDSYNENELNFPWTECSNANFEYTNDVMWLGHNGVEMNSGKFVWPQILSPKFHIPDAFKIYAYMRGNQTYGLFDPVTVSLGLSTESAGDYEENGNQVHFVRLDLSMGKTKEQTSSQMYIYPDYPCFQIEHESAYTVPTTVVEHLQLMYGDK